MATFNKALPDGDKDAELLDDDCQENFEATEDIVGKEHVMVTGGDQTGRHEFDVTTKNLRDAESEFVPGSLCIVTDEVTDYEVLTWCNETIGPTWYHVLEPYLNNANDWVNGQHCTTKALTPGANIASDWADGNVFSVTLDQNSTLSNPTKTADKSAMRFYIITNDNPAKTLAYGADFTVDGVNYTEGPTINPTADSVTVLMAVQDEANKIQLSVVGGSGVTSASGFDSTWDGGYYEIPGTGLLEQWVVAANINSGDPIAFATNFADANYCVSLTAEENSLGIGNGLELRIQESSRAAGGFNVLHDSGTLAFVHVRAIGLKP